MKRYMKYVTPYWMFFVLAPMLMVIEVYCEVRIPALAAHIVNVGIMNEDGGEVVRTALKMIGYVCFAIVGGSSASFCAAKAAVSFSSSLRFDLFKKIQTFSFANIDKFSTGSLITRMTNDITQLENLVTMCLRMLFRSPGMLIGSVIMAFTLSKKIAMVFVVLIPLLAVIIFGLLMISYKKFEVLQKKVDDLNSYVREILTNVRVIKALTRENYEVERFGTVNENLKKTGLSAYRITILQMPILTLVVNVATIGIIWFGSQLLGAGEMLIGDISACITYLTQILMSVASLAMIFLQGSKALASGKRISEVLATEVDIKDHMDAKHEVTRGDITFEHVDFKYYKNSEEHVLSDISISIKAGQTVGIIGSTGCGKTSFVHLIPRLYDVDGGNIFVDGVNVKDYSLKNLRQGISIVLQNNLLFSGSIAENLRWGDKLATKEELEQVADGAAASEFINSQSKGYEAKLEQGGVNLSGGQKQRLCIARALLKKPKILILDDSTSALDAATEAKIKTYFNTELKGMTKIIIAQRISSVSQADLILVMNEGTIEARGTHKELLAESITYQEIYHSQMNQEGMA